MANRRIRGLRIFHENERLHELPDNHPAVKALIIHAEARDLCVGREISSPNMFEEPIDQEWFSAIDQRIWTFSGFSYAFISFDLVLDGWLGDDRNRLQPFERDFLQELPRLRGLLLECESAALSDSNNRVLPVIAKANAFLNAFEQSIIARVGQVNIENDNRPIVSLWGTGKRE